MEAVEELLLHGLGYDNSIVATAASGATRTMSAAGEADARAVLSSLVTPDDVDAALVKLRIAIGSPTAELEPSAKPLRGQAGVDKALSGELPDSHRAAHRIGHGASVLALLADTTAARKSLDSLRAGFSACVGVLRRAVKVLQSSKDASSSDTETQQVVAVASYLVKNSTRTLRKLAAVLAAEAARTRTTDSVLEHEVDEAAPLLVTALQTTYGVASDALECLASMLSAHPPVALAIVSSKDGMGARLRVQV